MREAWRFGVGERAGLGEGETDCFSESSGVERPCSRIQIQTPHTLYPYPYPHTLTLTPTPASCGRRCFTMSERTSTRQPCPNSAAP
jgi:hypothetical protein